jgi:hypothetical protein
MNSLSNQNTEGSRYLDTDNPESQIPVNETPCGLNIRKFSPDSETS